MAEYFQGLDHKIRALAEKKNAVILAHNYQNEEVQLLADYIGDSLELSRIAADIEREMIVFAGVKFMAETAKILSPNKRVLLPRLDAGCPMADMLIPEDVRNLRTKHPDAAVVTYVNSSVEVKAESDICCTSANAASVVRAIPADKIIFIPDRNLGAWVQSQVPEKHIITFEGYCYVHNRIKKQDVEEMKNAHPRAVVLAHPEVRMEVLELADEVLSTSGMLKFASRFSGEEFIVLTEEGLLQRMRREFPENFYFSAGEPKICSNMKRTGVSDLLQALELERYEIVVEESLAKRATRSLKEMLKYQ